MTIWIWKRQLCFVFGLTLLLGGIAQAQLSVTCNWAGQIYRKNLGSGQYTYAAPVWGDASGWSLPGNGAGTCPGGVPNNSNYLHYSVVIRNASSAVLGPNLGKLASVSAVNSGGSADINPTLTSLSITNSHLMLSGPVAGSLTTGSLNVDSSLLSGGTYTIQNDDLSAPINTFTNATIESSSLLFQGSGAAAYFTGSLGLNQYSTHVGKNGTGSIHYGVLSNLTGSPMAPVFFDGVTISAGTLSHPTATIVDTGGGMLFLGTNLLNGGVLVGNYRISAGSSTAFNGTQLEGEISIDPSSVLNFDGNIVFGGIDIGPEGLLYTAGTVVNNPPGAINNAGTFDNFSTLTNAGAINNKPIATFHSYNPLNNTESGVITNAGELVNLSKLSNAGRLTNDSGATLENDGTLTNELEGTIANAGLLDNKSVGDIENYGTLKSHGTLKNAGTLQINAGGTLDNSMGATLENAGLLGNHAKLNNSGTLMNTSGGQLYNYATLTNNSGGTVTNAGDFENDFALNNDGTLNNLRGKFSNQAGGTITNTGTFGNDSTLDNAGSIRNDSEGTLDNYGTLTNDHGGRLTNAGFLENADTLDNSGALNNNNGGTLQSDGTLNNYGTLNNNSGGTLTNSRFLSNQGLLKNAGTLSNDSGTLFYNYDRLTNSSGGAITNDGYMENDGTLANNHGGTITNSAYMRNKGTLNNAGILDNYGTLDNTSSASIINTGTVWVVAGQALHNDGLYKQPAGSTVIDGSLFSSTLVQIDGGTLSGTGTITGNVFLGGRLSPGDSPGTLSINGDYTQSHSGTFFAELAGLTPGTQYDQVVVSGNASLNGTLDVVLLSGFTVQVGDSFVLMTFASEDGQFSAYNLPSLAAGERWQWVYGPADFTLSIESGGTPTPEPASFLLLGTGLLGMAGTLRRKFWD